MKTKSELEIKEYAKENSKTIVIRSYDNGGSIDTVRKSTKKESTIIEAVLFGALCAINNGSDIQSCKDTAEYTGDQLLPNVNGYDTFYRRIEAGLK
jgi:hypothetical protein